MIKEIIIVLIFNSVLYSSIAQDIIIARNEFKNPVAGKTDDEGAVKNETDNNQFSFSRVSYSDELAQMNNIAGRYFNEEIEKKYQLLNTSYAYDVPQVPGSLTTHTVIQKPVIYSAISKLYKYYKTESKKGRINKVTAEIEYNYILDVGLTVLYCNTESFEEVLKKIKEPEALSFFLQSVELTD